MYGEEPRKPQNGGASAGAGTPNAEKRRAIIGTNLNKIKILFRLREVKGLIGERFTDPESCHRPYMSDLILCEGS